MNWTDNNKSETVFDPVCLQPYCPAIAGSGAALRDHCGLFR